MRAEEASASTMDLEAGECAGFAGFAGAHLGCEMADGGRAVGGAGGLADLTAVDVSTLRELDPSVRDGYKVIYDRECACGGVGWGGWWGVRGAVRRGGR